MDHRNNKTTTFGVIIGTRGIFNAELAAADRAKLLKVLNSEGFGAVIPDEGETTRGGIETRKDAALCADLFKKRADDIDGIIVALPNFGDELGIIETLRRSGLRVPILVQASKDEISKVDIHSRRDAFCGKISVCNNLYQYGYSFTDTAEHTEDPDSPVFLQDLRRFAAICRTVKGMKNARIGMIGTRPDAFQTVRFSEKILQAYGITVVPVDLSWIFARARGLGDGDVDLAAKVEGIRAYGRIPDRIPREHLLRSARFSVAVERWLDEQECTASAVQCWNSIQLNYGCAACLTMSMLSNALRPSACEVDVTGALSMLALSLAGNRPAALLDWNNNYGNETDKCVNTHCSNFPKDFIADEVEISELDLLGEDLGRENSFGAIKGIVKAGPATFLRLTTDDKRGVIKGYAGEGSFTDDPFAMDGGIAVVQVPRLRELLGYICKNGFEHHVAMTRGQVGSVLEEALGNYLGWDMAVHGKNQ
ncbi:MAG: fucose isomerase [Spirochaetales bacterium]|nr:fucose isomerase [Spirochaetales bacterium]